MTPEDAIQAALDDRAYARKEAAKANAQAELAQSNFLALMHEEAKKALATIFDNGEDAFVDERVLRVLVHYLPFVPQNDEDFAMKGKLERALAVVFRNLDGDAARAYSPPLDFIFDEEGEGVVYNIRVSNESWELVIVSLLDRPFSCLSPYASQLSKRN